MKVSLVLIFVLAQVSASSYSQITKLTLDMEKVALSEFFNEIENSSEFRFFYDNEEIDPLTEISVNVKRTSIENVLADIFTDSDISYEIFDSYIILKKKESVNGVIKSFTKLQEITIKGKITDMDGSPLPGVNIVEKGTTNGAVSDLDGNYTINLNSPNAVLVFSYVGFLTEEVEVGGQTVIDLTLIEDIQSLEEVVVIGYGTQKKMNQTGSVSTVDFEEVSETRPITTLAQGIAGQAAGVMVSQRSGKPGSDNGNIFIRGVGTLNNASPLVVIDGLVGSLSDVVPENVKSVSVLKDAASASIYGNRAANGVILITTKKGSAGKTNFSYNAYFGSQKADFDIEMIWDYPTHMEVINQAQINSGKPEIFSQATIDDYRAGTDPVLYPNTNWFEAVFEPTIMQRHNLSASGGSENVRYMFSANILDNRGSVKNSDYKRYSFRSNVEADLNNWLTAGANVFGYWSDEESPGDLVEKVISVIGNSVPGILPIDDQGRLGGPWVPGENASTNNVYGRFEGNYGTQNITKILAKIYTTVKFTDNIKWTTSFAPTIQYDYDFSQVFPRDIWNLKDNSIIRSTTETTLEEGYRKYYRTIFDSYVTYNTTIANDHNIKVLAGYNQEYETASKMSAYKTDLFTNETTVMDAASGADPVVKGNFSDRSLRSYFGRVNYDFQEKYLLEANLRFDGSSKFSKNERWGVFPSVSVGWVMTNEEFMKNVTALSSLKVRASWGQLGNNRVSDYGTQPLYNLSNYVFGGSITAGAAPSAIPNDILKWETTTQSNIGIESSFLDRRLSMEFDLFNRRTEDILINLPIPLVNGGLTAPPQNAGIVDNKGFELTLGWRDHVGKDFRYGFSGNFTYIKNEVVKYLGEVGTISGNHILQEGLQIDSWYLREVEGIATQEKIDQMVADGYTFSPMPAPGDFIYIDQQKEGEEGYKVIDENDRVATGSSIPKYTFGFSLDFGYKGFDLNILAQGMAGIDDYFENDWYTSDLTNGSLISKAALDAWTPENPNATFPRLTTGAVPNNTVANDFWLRDASFLRIKNITLGYSIPERLIQKIGIERLRLYVSAENYFTIKSSEFVGFDPELSALNYPIMKTLTVGLNINF